MDYTLQQKLTALPLIAQQKLQSILCAIPDQHKELCIDAPLIRPLELVCGASWLRQHGVARICKFDPTRTPLKRTLLVYMISASLARFGQVLAQIRDICAHQPQHAAPELLDHTQFHVIAVPTLPGSWAACAERDGLAGVVQLHRFNWDFLPLDATVPAAVLSCEMPQLYREVYVRGETGLLAAVAQSVRIVQMVTGRPSVLLTYGRHAELVVQQLLEAAAPQPPANGAAAAGPMIDAMLVVDRDRDYASALLTPVIYAGLLMDVFRGAAGTLSTDAHAQRIRAQQLDWLRVEKPTAKSSAGGSKPPAPNAATTSHHHHLRLSARTDAIYAAQRYRPFAEVVQQLGAQAKQIGAQRAQLRDMQLDAMQQYVAEQLPQLAAQKRELTRHMALCECIVAELGAGFEQTLAVQEAMLANEQRRQTLQRCAEQLATEPNRTAALRQMALMHVTCGGGLTHEEATGFMQAYMNAFGYAALPAFVRLAEVGLFPSLDGGSKLVQRSLSTLNLMKQTAFQAECAKLRQLPKASAKASETDASSASTTTTTTDSGGSSADAAKPADRCPSYVFNGAYIPLIAQLAQMLLSAQRLEDFATRTVQADLLKLWHFGAQTPAKHPALGRHPAELVADVRAGVVPDLLPLKGRTVWLHIVGGVTMAEIAAAELVGRQTGGTVVVTSDRLMACDDLVQAVLAEGDD